MTETCMAIRKHKQLRRSYLPSHIIVNVVCAAPAESMPAVQALMPEAAAPALPTVLPDKDPHHHDHCLLNGDW